jgi:hypothetical protein
MTNQINLEKLFAPNFFSKVPYAVADAGRTRGWRGICSGYDIQKRKRDFPVNSICTT